MRVNVRRERKSDMEYPGGGELTPVVKNGPLTWSQEFLWFGYNAPPPADRSALNLPLLVRVPTDTDVAACEAVLTALVARHESLRTTYTLARNGRPEQLVRAPYSPSVRLVFIDDLAELYRASIEIQRVAIDVEMEWPMSAHLFVANDFRMLFLACSHLATDAAGLKVLAEAITQGLSGTIEPSDNEPIGQPLEQVALQSSAAGQRIRQAGHAYTKEVYSRSAAWMFAGLAQGRSLSGSGYIKATLHSQRLPAATSRLAARLRVTRSAVYLAAFAAFLRDLSGAYGLTINSDFNNRLTPPSRRSVACMFQPAVLWLPLPIGITARETIAVAQKAMLTGFRRARYSFIDSRDTIAETQATRGLLFRICVNFDFNEAQHAKNKTSSNELSTHGATVKCYEVGHSHLDIRLDVRPGPGMDELVLIANSTLVPQEQARRLIEGIAAFLLTLAEDQTATDRDITDLVAQSGISRPTYGPQWTWVDGCLVNRDQVATIVSTHPTVRSCVVVVERTDGHDVLTAYLECPRGAPSLAELRRHVLDRLDTHAAVIVPHRFVVCPSAPAEPARAHDGVGPMFDESETSAEIALRNAITPYADDVAPDMSRNYFAVGGKAATATAVVRALADRGYGGLHPHDLLQPASLKHLATFLVRLSPEKPSSEAPSDSAESR